MKTVSMMSYNQDFKEGLTFLIEKTPEQIIEEGSNLRKLEVNCKVMTGSLARKAQYSMTILTDPNIDWEDFNFTNAELIKWKMVLLNEFKTIGYDHLELVLRVMVKYFNCDVTDLSFSYTQGVFRITEPTGMNFLIAKEGTIQF